MMRPKLLETWQHLIHNQVEYLLVKTYFNSLLIFNHWNKNPKNMKVFNNLYKPERSKDLIIHLLQSIFLIRTKRFLLQQVSLQVGNNTKKVPQKKHNKKFNSKRDQLVNKNKEEPHQIIVVKAQLELWKLKNNHGEAIMTKKVFNKVKLNNLINLQSHKVKYLLFQKVLLVKVWYLQNNL